MKTFLKQDRKIFVLILFLHVLACIFFFQPLIELDGLYYYYWGHSLVFDGDVQMLNQRVNIPGRFGLPKMSKTGFMANSYPIGMGLLYSPSLGLAWLVEHAFMSSQDPYTSPGYDFFFSVVYLFNTVILTLVSHLALFILLRKKVSSLAAFLATTWIFFGTPIMGYTYVVPSYVHSVGLFCVVFLLCLFYSERIEFTTKLSFYAIVSGILIMSRYQDVIFLCLPLYDCFINRKRLTIRSLAEAFLIFLVLLSPMVLAHSEIVSSLAASSDVEFRDFFYGFSSDNSTFFFHPVSGLFTLSPITIIGLIGFFVAPMQKRLKLLYLFIIVISYLLITTRFDLFLNEFYGIRRFISCLPILCLGLAHMLHSARKSRLLSMCLVSISSLFMAWYIFKISFFVSRSSSLTEFSLARLVQKTFIPLLFEHPQTLLTAEKIAVYLILVFAVVSLIVFIRSRAPQRGQALVLLVIIPFLFFDVLIIKNKYETEKYSFYNILEDVTRKRMKKNKIGGAGTNPKREYMKKLKKLGNWSDRSVSHPVKLRTIIEYPGEPFDTGYSFKGSPKYRRELGTDVTFGTMTLVFTQLAKARQRAASRQYLSTIAQKLKVSIEEQDAEFKVLATRFVNTPHTVPGDIFESRIHVVLGFSSPVTTSFIEISIPEKNETLKITGLCFGPGMVTDSNPMK